MLLTRGEHPGLNSARHQAVLVVLRHAGSAGVGWREWTSRGGRHPTAALQALERLGLARVERDDLDPVYGQRWFAVIEAA